MKILKKRNAIIAIIIICILLLIGYLIIKNISYNSKSYKRTTSSETVSSFQDKANEYDSTEVEETSDFVIKSVSTENVETKSEETDDVETSTLTSLSFEQIEQNCSAGGEFTKEYRNYINSTIHNDGGLNEYDGTLINRWGNKETYYNLSMEGVVEIMRNNDYSKTSYPYWIRDDGVKMLGPYILVAANLQIYPRCEIVNTSLGKGIVADTGDFANQNAYQFDIATSW